MTAAGYEWEWERYRGDPVAQARMARGLCPECGQPEDRHGGRGGPGCSLTDTGVAGRIGQYRQDQAAAWRALGCRTMRTVKGSAGQPDGRAAWRLRAPRSSRDEWIIEAAHCPYLGYPPYDHGPDAWRISIQTPRPANPDQMQEVAHLVAGSEAAALEAVTWLDAAAQEDQP